MFEHQHDGGCDHNHMSPEAYTKHMRLFVNRASQELIEDEVKFTHGCMVDFAADIVARTAISIMLARKPGAIVIDSLGIKNQVFAHIQESAMDKMDMMIQNLIKAAAQPPEEEGEFE